MNNETLPSCIYRKNVNMAKNKKKTKKKNRGSAILCKSELILVAADVACHVSCLIKIRDMQSAVRYRQRHNMKYSCAVRCSRGFAEQKDPLSFTLLKQCLQSTKQTHSSSKMQIISCLCRASSVIFTQFLLLVFQNAFCKE